MGNARPKRIDNGKIKWTGEATRRYYGLEWTGHSEYEGCEAWDYSFRWGGREYGVELKTSRSPFNGGRKYNFMENGNWDRGSYDGGVVPTGRTWMMNYYETDGVTPGKFLRMGDNECLQYLFPDGWVIFSPRALKRAFMGKARYWGSRRSEFEREKAEPCWQWKAVINLEEGDFVPCTPPEEFFKRKHYEDFNRLNRQDGEGTLH